MATSTPTQLELFTSVAFMHMDSSLDAGLTPSIERQLDAAKNHIRYGAYAPKTVFAMYANLVGDRMRLLDCELTINRHRLTTFERNTKCVCCGIEGNVFLLERHINDREFAQSLNLYAFHNGKMVLLTVDHILPDSLAGRYNTLNFQTMCSDCNRKKQNFMSAAEIALVRACMDNHVKSWAYRPFIEVLLTMQEHMLTIKDKKQRAPWVSALNKASKLLVQGKSHEKYMRPHTHNLLQTLDSLTGKSKTGKVVKPMQPVPTLSTYQRFRAWVTAQVKFIRSIRIVVQTA